MRVRKQLKTITVLLLLILVITTATSGTLAWMKSKSNEVINTFTYGKINIDLKETDTLIDKDNDETTNTYLMDLLEKNITKDAIVTVEKDSEECWLLIKLEKSDNFDEFLNYEIDEEWTQLPEYPNIYYMEVIKEDVKQTFSVFKDNKVTLNSEVSNTQLNSLTKETYPTLNITAYAIQKEGIDTAVEAWSLISNQ